MFEIGNARIIGKRDTQEDYFASLPIGDGLLCIVADGMGGYEGGEIASSISVKSFIKFFKKSFREDKIAELLVLSSQYANEQLEDIKQRDDSLTDMGNTIIATYAINSTLYWVNIGDSILYRYRDRRVKRINADHSIAGELQERVDKGFITQEEADSNPERHALTSALTGYEIPLIEQSQIEIRDDDIFILASDGIHTLERREIERIILKSIDSQDLADTLVDTVVNRDMINQDNTAIVVFQKERKPALKMEKTQIIDIPKKNNIREKKRIEKKDNRGNYKIILIVLVMLIGTFLLADAVKVTNIAEKATFRVVNLTARGAGTGFIINDKGYLITNNHVTKGYTVGKILILNKYKKYRNVKMIKTYPNKDITILKIEGYSDGQFLKLQEPSLIKKGHESFSLGYPGGSDIVGDVEAQLDSTIKSGDVSKILTTSSSNGKFPSGYKLIETSSDINGGNSGGPLLSRLGTVIGINTFKNSDRATLTRSGSVVQGIFWAIHVEELIKILDENSIKYTLSTDDIGMVSVEDIKSNSKIIFIVIGIIIAILVLLLFLIKKKNRATLDPRELSKMVRDRVKKYEPKNPPPKQSKEEKISKPPKQKTRAILVELDRENKSLPKIRLESKSSIIVGRSMDCNVTIEDREVSSEHIRITLLGSVVEVEDLNSANGTYIDGKKLKPHEKTTLKAGERLILSNENCVYFIAGTIRKETTKIIRLIPKDSSLPIISMEKRVVVGRSSQCDITIKNSIVSRRHLEINPSKNGLEIKDLGSGNGTYINGKKINKGEDSAYLLANEQLIIGSEDIIYEMEQ